MLKQIPIPKVVSKSENLDLTFDPKVQDLFLKHKTSKQNSQHHIII